MGPHGAHEPHGREDGSHGGLASHGSPPLGPMDPMGTIGPMEPLVLMGCMEPMCTIMTVPLGKQRVQSALADRTRAEWIHGPDINHTSVSSGHC